MCHMDHSLRVLEVVEVVRAHVLRESASFRGSYLLTECPKFHQINTIRCKMTTGFPKCGHNRKSRKKTGIVMAFLNLSQEKYRRILTTRHPT
jgi:hypothetical protein